MDASALSVDFDSVLLVVTVIAAVALLISLTSEPSRKDRASAPPGPVSRWRVFRIRSEVLHNEVSEKTAVVAEEAGGVRLLARPFPGKGWEIATAGKERRGGKGRERPSDEVKVEITRRGVLTSRFDASLDGRPWLSIRKLDGGSRSAPEIRLHKRGASLKIAGSPYRRDYEIRQDGKLVAMASKPPSAGNEAATGQYMLEILRTVDPKPLLALVLCLEAALPPVK